MARSWNVFSIGRRGGDEDQLTEMLAWLATSVPGVRSALMRLAFDEMVDPNAVEVVTQHSINGVGRLDAVLESPGHRVVVESKLGSVYGDKQLDRYLRWLADQTKNDRKTSALMTLTARPASWSEADVRTAEELDVTQAARRWEELHQALQPLVDVAGEGDLAAQITKDFLDMLRDEDLVPFAPLSDPELGTAWADAWAVVRRYRDFFHGCKSVIVTAVDAETASNSWSDRGDWFWQDYLLRDGARLAIGLFHTDENDARRPDRIPILWASLLHADGARLPNPAAALLPGWAGGKDFYDRPTIWRPLPAILAGSLTLEDQHEAVAQAAHDALAWHRSTRRAEGGTA